VRERGERERERASTPSTHPPRPQQRVLLLSSPPAVLLSSHPTLSPSRNASYLTDLSHATARLRRCRVSPSLSLSAHHQQHVNSASLQLVRSCATSSALPASQSAGSPPPSHPRAASVPHLVPDCHHVAVGLFLPSGSRSAAAQTDCRAASAARPSAARGVAACCLTRCRSWLRIGHRLLSTSAQ
jgi:hypothetical protein